MNLRRWHYDGTDGLLSHLLNDHKVEEPLIAEASARGKTEELHGLIHDRAEALGVSQSAIEGDKEVVLELHPEIIGMTIGAGAGITMRMSVAEFTRLAVGASPT